MKKTLKFRDHLIPSILSREKTSSWRLYDDKDLQVGDEIEFLHFDTKEKFAEGVIVETWEKTLGTVTDSDYHGHTRYESEEAMYENFRKYYGDKVGPTSPVKIIKFSLI